MKKIMIFAAACAALVACSKEAETVVDANHFEKGQEVTLTVKAGESSTRVSSELDSGTDEIDFKWEEGDKIQVTVGTESSEFTLIGKGGSASGSFKGTMPASGKKFNVQYPCKEPVLESQAYSSNEALPRDMMLFTATGCDLEDPFTLSAQNAALRLNLWGTDQTISKIVVTNTSSTAATKPTYTLNISGGKLLSSDSSKPTPFFIIVPAGNYNFSAEVIDDGTASNSSLAARPADAIQTGVFTVGANNVFNTSSAKTFTAGQILNMDAMQVYFTKVYFSKGNLYYDGSFNFENTQYAYTSTYDANHICRFRWANNSGTLSTDISSAISTDKYLSCSTEDVFFTNATTTTPRNDFTVNGVSNTWRTLSGDDSGEWYYLLNSRPGVTVGNTSGCRYAFVKVNSICGMLIFPDTFTWPSDVSQQPSTFNTSALDWNTYDYSVEEFTKLQNAGCVFLPAAGIRRSGLSELLYVGLYGRYWSSSPYGSDVKVACFLYFMHSGVWPAGTTSRACGVPVRLVSAAQ